MIPYIFISSECQLVHSDRPKMDKYQNIFLLRRCTKLRRDRKSVRRFLGLENTDDPLAYQYFILRIFIKFGHKIA